MDKINRGYINRGKNNHRCLLMIVACTFTFIFIEARPLRGNYNWRNLVGNYKLVLGKCRYTKTSTATPSREFVPESSVLRINESQSDSSSGLILVSKIINGWTGTEIYDINKPESTTTTGGLSGRPCDVATRVIETYTTENGVNRLNSLSYPNCQNENLTERINESIDLAMGADGRTLTMIVERDLFNPKHEGFACRYTKQ